MPRKKKIELSEVRRRSPFDLKIQGIKEDKTKNRRWVKKDRIGERKEMDGYRVVPGKSEDGTTKVKGMTLMERDRGLAEDSARNKELLTRQRTHSYKESLGQEVEKLSQKHDMDLHKVMKNYEK